jgi:hypothetical protein
MSKSLKDQVTNYAMNKLDKMARETSRFVAVSCNDMPISPPMVMTKVWNRVYAQVGDEVWEKIMGKVYDSHNVWTIKKLVDNF